MLRIALLAVVCVLFQGMSVCAQEAPPASPDTRFFQAQKLEKEKKFTEALQLYLDLPGAESFAMNLVRQDPAQFLPELEKLASESEKRRNPRVLLLLGETLLALNQRENALKRYRQFADCLARNATDGWETGKIPADYYPVGFATPEDALDCYRCSADSPHRPFECGPGSFRDNVLLNRFLMLEAWKDAEQEFERIWNLHQRLVGNRAFPGQSLQFALDYAWFLKTRNQPKQELNVLLKPINRMDLDRNPVFEYQRDVYAALRNPNQNQKNTQLPHLKPGTPPPVLFQIRCGVTQRVFLKLVLERLTELNQLSALEQLIAKELNSGNRAAQLIQALMLEMQGKPEAARQLELSYIEHLPVSAASKHFYKALVFEKYGEFELALNECKQLLPFLNQPVTIPDAIEFDSTNLLLPFNQSAIIAQPCPLNAREVLKRMEKLAAATGNVKEAFQFKLKQMDQPIPNLTGNLLFQLQNEALTTDSLPGFFEWVRTTQYQSPYNFSQAQLAWAAKDLESVIQNFIKSQSGHPENSSWPLLPEWRDRVSDLGKEQYQTFLEALVQHYPQNAFFGLELLEVKNQLQSEEAIRYLELLLDQKTVEFHKGGSPNTKYQFSGYGDLALVLMRHYRTFAKAEKILALALRLARLEFPFGLQASSGTSSRQQFERTELWQPGNQIFDLAFQSLTDETEVKTLVEALTDSPWTTARDKFAERLKNFLPTEELASSEFRLPSPKQLPRWANLPPGVQLVASLKPVLCFCRDEKWLYVGHLWGVAIYDFQGNFVTRVATQSPATHLAVAGGAVWVGTDNGLFRLDCQTFQLSHLSLAWGLTEKIRNEKLKASDPTEVATWWDKPDNHTLINQVTSLAAQQDWIWVETSHSIFRYHTLTHELRMFPPETISDERVRLPKLSLIDGQYVWASLSGSGFRDYFRYNPQTDQWTQLKIAPLHILGVLGIFKGQVWVRYLNVTTREPGFGHLKSESMTLTPIPVFLPGAGESGPQICLGIVQGKLLFKNRSGRLFLFDETSQTFHRLTDPQQLPGIDLSKVSQNEIHFIHNDEPSLGSISTSLLNLFKTPAEVQYWQSLKLPTGVRILSGKILVPNWLDYYLGFGDWASSKPGSPGAKLADPDDLGLKIQPPGEPLQPIRLPSDVDNLSGNIVFSLTADPSTHTIWASTNHGITVLTDTLEICRTFTDEDGLSRDFVFSAIRQDQDWFLNHSCLPARVNISRLHLKTGVIHKLEKVAYSLQDQLQTLCPVQGNMNSRDRLPFLGGRIIGQQKIGEKTYVYGFHGMVVAEGSALPKPVEYPQLPVHIASDQSAMQRLEAEAKNLPESPTFDEFRQHLQTSNPYLLAKVLSLIVDRSQWVDSDRDQLPHSVPDAGKTILAQSYPQPDLLNLVVPLTTHANPRVRATAFKVVQTIDSPAALSELKKLATDSEASIRAAAALELAKRGNLPGLKWYEEILEHSSYLLPVGLDQFEKLDAHTVYEVFIPQLTPDRLKLLLSYPLSDVQEARAITLCQNLGKALTANPDLLKSFLTTPHFFLSRETSYDQRKRVSQLLILTFRNLGKETLPLFRQALTSTNVTTRTLGITGICGLGNQADHLGLITALKQQVLSVDWVFDALEIIPIIPRISLLTRLYTIRKKTPPPLIENSGPVIQAGTYTNWGSFLDLAQTWPSLHSDSLQSVGHGNAAGEIISESQLGYRLTQYHSSLASQFRTSLANDETLEKRLIAIQTLAMTEKVNVRTDTLKFLRMLSDSHVHVRVDAAVSLLILNHPTGQKTIEYWLNRPGSLFKRLAVSELGRVSEDFKLKPFLNQLNQCATDPTLPAETQAQARALIKRIESIPR